MAHAITSYAPPVGEPSQVIAVVSEATGRVIALLTDVEEPPSYSEPVTLHPLPLTTRAQPGGFLPVP